jgi:hypothetical protein
LDEGGHDERGVLVEVYDDPQVSTRIEIAAIETLATWSWILLTLVRKADGVQDRCSVLDHLRPAALQMADGALVEDDEATIRIEGAQGIERHSKNATPSLRRGARSAGEIV